MIDFSKFFQKKALNSSYLKSVAFIYLILFLYY